MTRPQGRAQGSVGPPLRQPLLPRRRRAKEEVTVRAGDDDLDPSRADRAESRARTLGVGGRGRSLWPNLFGRRRFRWSPGGRRPHETPESVLPYLGPSSSFSSMDLRHSFPSPRNVNPKSCFRNVNPKSEEGVGNRRGASRRVGLVV